MAGARAAAVKGGHPSAYYRAQLGAPEPEATVVAVRHYHNLFELPVLFYLALVVAGLTGQVTGLVLALAWLFVATRIVHSAIQCSYNKVMHRFRAYLAGGIVLWVLWVVLGVGLLRG
jgi:hypothetical protein